MKSVSLRLILFLASVVLGAGCRKDFLDKSPDTTLTVPKSLDELQSILDNDLVIVNSPFFGEIGIDDYYFTTTTWKARPADVRNAYVWAKEIFESGTSADWRTAYQALYYINVVLDVLSDFDVTTSNQLQYNQVKGMALFYRAYYYNNLLQVFAKAYDKNTAATDLGLPLKLDSDPRSKTTRSRLQVCYDQVIKDAQTALNLLPYKKVVVVPSHPSKEAAFALLARISLNMADYPNALIYADSSLKTYNVLIDYNELDTLKATAFPANTNNEVLFQNYLRTYSVYTYAATMIDSTLYKSYASDDLRRPVFFRRQANGSDFFKGSYSGTYSLFGGLATDEMYLVRAECYARAGNRDASLKDLNDLLIKRYKKNTFVPVSALDANSALSIVLSERRKELITRGLRWPDLRRLNKEDRFKKTLTRIVDGVTYTLPPNDARYVYPFPLDEIQLSGVEQNVR